MPRNEETTVNGSTIGDSAATGGMPDNDMCDRQMPAPCPVALLAADWAILDDHITALWSDPETEGGLCLALDTWRNALTARALALAPTSAAGAAFQAHLIALDITTAACGDMPDDERARTLIAAATGARNLLRYLTTLRMMTANRPGATDVPPPVGRGE